MEEQIAAIEVQNKELDELIEQEPEDLAQVQSQADELATRAQQLDKDLLATEERMQSLKDQLTAQDQAIEQL